MTEINMPDWRTFAAGARVRVALWLASEVGTGGIFTKADLRQAFPGVEQVDRRMRDLRVDGWVLATNHEDVSLETDELRLVAIGARVWEPGHRSKSTGRTVTAKTRQEIFEADGFMCVYCGIGAGEPYPDERLRTAKLLVSRVHPGAGGPAQLVTVCDRCHAGHAEPSGGGDVAAAIASLDPASRDRFCEWVKVGVRERDALAALWAAYMRLSSAERAEIRQEVLRSGSSQGLL